MSSPCAGAATLRAKGVGRVEPVPVQPGVHLPPVAAAHAPASPRTPAAAPGAGGASRRARSMACQAARGSEGAVLDALGRGFEPDAVAGFQLLRRLVAFQPRLEAVAQGRQRLRQALQGPFQRLARLGQTRGQRVEVAFDVVEAVFPVRARQDLAADGAQEGLGRVDPAGDGRRLAVPAPCRVPRQAPRRAASSSRGRAGRGRRRARPPSAAATPACRPPPVPRSAAAARARGCGRPRRRAASGAAPPSRPRSAPRRRRRRRRRTGGGPRRTRSGAACRPRHRPAPPAP